MATTGRINFVTKKIWIDKIEPFCSSFKDLDTLTDKQLMIMATNTGLVQYIHDIINKYKNMKDEELGIWLNELKINIFCEEYKYSDHKIILLENFNVSPSTFKFIYDCFGEYKNIKKNIKYKTGNVIADFILLGEHNSKKNGIELKLKIVVCVDDAKNFNSTKENKYIQQIFKKIYEYLIEDDNEKFNMKLEHSEIKCFPKFILLYKNIELLSEREFYVDNIKCKKRIKIDEDKICSLN